MKILFITSLLGSGNYGGAEISMRLLLNALTAKKIDVKALTTRKVFDDAELVSISFQIEIPKKVLTLGNGLIDYFLYRKIRQKLELINPDIIHIQDTYILPAAIAANKTLKIPCVATIRNSVLDQTWHMMFPRPISTALSLRNKIIINALRDVDCVIPVSEYIKAELVKKGIESEKMIQIYNLPPAFNIPNKRKNDEQNAIVHLFAPGQLEPFKGFSKLIVAIKIVTKTHPNVHLVIAGGGSQEAKLQEQTKNLHLEPYIKFVGKIPFLSIIEYYVQCDIVIFPSIYAEPLGRVAIEGSYFGKPVIACKVGGIPEVVKHNETGILVAPTDIYELANSIITLVENKELRRTLGIEGKLLIEKVFSPEKIVLQHLEVYKKVQSIRNSGYNKIY